MGRIRTKFVKNLSEQLIAQYPDKFSKDFESNKKVLDELKVVDSKIIRNKIAGYIVCIIRKKKF